MEFEGESPSKEAQYYILICEDSFRIKSPCFSPTTRITENYPDIKKSEKVEVVLYIRDETEFDMQGLLERRNAVAPLTYDDTMFKLSKITPQDGEAYVLDKRGRLIYQNGSWNVLEKWQYATLDFTKNRREIKAYMKKVKEEAKRRAEDEKCKLRD